MPSALAQLLSAPLDAPLVVNELRGRQISDEGALDATYRLRFRVFGDERFINPADYPDGRFCDRFDGVSSHFAVEAPNGEFIATTRFVLPSVRGYATEEYFDFTRPEIDRSRLGEFGRLAIERAHRGGAREPMLILLALVYRCMRHHGIEWVYAFMPPKLVASYSALGCVSHPLEIQPTTPATLQRRRSMQGYFERQQVGPVLFRLTEMLEAIYQQ